MLITICTTISIILITYSSLKLIGGCWADSLKLMKECWSDSFKAKNFDNENDELSYEMRFNKDAFKAGKFTNKEMDFFKAHTGHDFVLRQPFDDSINYLDILLNKNNVPSLLAYKDNDYAIKIEMSKYVWHKKLTTKNIYKMDAEILIVDKGSLYPIDNKNRYSWLMSEENFASEWDSLKERL